MAEKKDASECSFTSVMALSEMGISSVPQCYVLPPPQRPTSHQVPHCSTRAPPVIDLSSLADPLLRSHMVEEVHWACKELGFFRNKMESYAKAVHYLQATIMEVVFESLGLRSDYLQKDIEQGTQVIAVNCYPACPEPSLALGLPPHSDYGMLTVILQDQQGLEFVDSNGKWQTVPVIKDALVVQVGDQLEVLSNGRYKSIVHRAIVNSEMKRFSIASLHSLAIDRKVVPAPELVDEKHPLSYKEGSFGDFLHFLTDNGILERRYIDTLRKD
ncbi:hypothetical protein ACS0TY_019706 [Phlomoides rotata]